MPRWAEDLTLDFAPGARLVMLAFYDMHLKTFLLFLEHC